jgi:hypothetical protein
VTELSELTSAIASVTGALVRCGVPYFITGSLASSMHAEFRATNDIDIVADFGRVDLSACIQRSTRSSTPISIRRSRRSVTERAST